MTSTLPSDLRRTPAGPGDPSASSAAAKEVAGLLDSLAGLSRSAARDIDSFLRYMLDRHASPGAVGEFLYTLSPSARPSLTEFIDTMKSSHAPAAAFLDASPKRPAAAVGDAVKHWEQLFADAELDRAIQSPEFRDLPPVAMLSAEMIRNICTAAASCCFVDGTKIGDLCYDFVCDVCRAIDDDARSRLVRAANGKQCDKAIEDVVRSIFGPDAALWAPAEPPSAAPWESPATGRKKRRASRAEDDERAAKRACMLRSVFGTGAGGEIN